MIAVKKKKNILWHILMPVMLILVLIPPVCSLVFWHFADRREQIRDFLIQAQVILEKSGANTELIVYEAQGKAVYPKKEEKRAQIQSLIEACQKIRDTELSDGTLSGISVKSDQGNFVEMNVSYDLYELEDLRMEMNHMAGQLKRSQEIQKDFFQNVSHELRNPLMSISGYAQGIEHGIFKEPETAAHTILEESGRLTELVSSLLTLSRIESRDNGTDNSLLPIPLDEILEDCLDRVSGLALKRGIQIQIHLTRKKKPFLETGN